MVAIHLGSLNTGTVELFYRLLIFALLHGGTIQSGFAPHYSSGLMTRVARHRDMAPQACMVSSPIYPLGTQLWVYGEKTGALLDCIVMDVSHPRDRERHIRTRRVVELSFEVTEALCGSTKERVVDCPVIVVKLE
jgi:hypothetical protein